MARIPLLQLSDVSLGYGGNPLFSGLRLIVQPEDRLALVGRNGCGKSTLLKVMAGQVEPDAGAVITSPGASIGFMEQDPDMTGFDTLGAFAARNLADGEDYRVRIAAEGLKFEPEMAVATASGGERRRAALAGLLAQAPELMLLDEPTNHLDIEAISWLENHLQKSPSAFVVISHDRAFLRATTRSTLWLDRGQLRRHDKGFGEFEAWRDKLWEEEDQTRHKLNRKIKSEARWAVEGISARRKRNQGRLRALADLRSQRRDMITRQGRAGMVLDAGQKSGKLVIEAQEIFKSFDGRPIISGFSTRILRGDRVALVGPNGAGKTTLLKILIKKLAPDKGTVRLGTNLVIAQFDQNRSGLNENASLWDNLVSDPDMRVSGQADQVMVRGQPRHVVGYLKEFLFDEEQARAPVRSLSGGEKSRLLLARLMARESNLLVLDEPTNDLDVETLDLLQELLANYDGTALIVSHDRDFLDRTATVTLAMEGDGTVATYAGGWSDYRAQRTGPPKAAPGCAKSRGQKKPGPQQKPAQAPEAAPRLSFTQAHRLKELPDEIARLEAEIAKLSEALSQGDLYSSDPARFQRFSNALSQRQRALDAAEAEWLDLEERAEQAAGREKP